LDFGFWIIPIDESGDLKLLYDAACCYSKSEKHWTIDPQGLAWEHFHTMSDALEFGNDTINHTGACCIPIRESELDSSSAKTTCCIPNDSSVTEGACCG
jgi:hypothetical protein